MPTVQTTLLFLTAGLALNLTPGPDMLYVATRSAVEGRRAGIVSALGIMTGCCVHIGALAAGLAALLESVPLAYRAVQLGGAAYLCYLGVRTLARPPVLQGPQGLDATGLRAIFRQGVVTNVLNPKVALFFLALLPQFVDPARGSAVRQILFLGMLFNLSGTLVNAGVAVLASQATGWLRAGSRRLRLAQRCTGAIFVGLGLRLAFSGRSS